MTFTKHQVARHCALDSYAAEIRSINFANGWHETARPFSADAILLVSEVVEAYEAFRNNDVEHIPEELADVFIRLLDTADRLGVNLGAEVDKKLAVNRTRGYRHGGKAE